MKKSLWIALISILVIPACQTNKEKANIVADKSINQTNSFNNLFIDSGAISKFLASDSQYNKYKQQYNDFYKQRNYECAWFDTGGIAEQTSNFMNLLSNAITTYNDSNLYDKKLWNKVAEMKQDTTHKTTLDVAGTELLLTGKFFQYATKVYKGSDIDATTLGWYIPRKKTDVTILLDSLIKDKSDANIPVPVAYKNLLDFLPKYNKLLQEGTWDSIAYPSKGIHIGDSSVLIGSIKKRLLRLEDMTVADTSATYDSSAYNAVKSFQDRMGMDTDGVIGKKMIDELNTPVQYRIQQILVNLERLRWMPELSAHALIFVNIPAYKLFVFDDGKPQFSMNVVVGSEATGTVIFTGTLKYVVFSPYWNIPPSIVKKEVLPGIQRNKNYLSSHHMEVFGKLAGGLPAVRQLPGGDNALGHVKFLFPNNYDIYLHDTNNKNAFNSAQRNLSHGCIRLQDPKKMAMYLLQEQPEWTSEKVDSMMNLKAEKWVTIKKQVSVMLGYYTAYVGYNGKLNFRKDIYNHDAEMAEKLFASR